MASSALPCSGRQLGQSVFRDRGGEALTSGTNWPAKSSLGNTKAGDGQISKHMPWCVWGVVVVVDVLFTWGGAVAASPSRCMQSLAGPLTRPCSGFTLETHRQLGIVFLLSTHTRGAGLGHLSRVLCGGPHCNVSQEKATWEWALEWGWTQN